MNIIKWLFKRGYKLSDFKKAVTLGGYSHIVYDATYNEDGSIYQVIGVVLYEGRRIFVIWNAYGEAFVVRERDAKFDLMFKLMKIWKK